MRIVNKMLATTLWIGLGIAYRDAGAWDFGKNEICKDRMAPCLKVNSLSRFGFASQNAKKALLPDSILTVSKKYERRSNFELIAMETGGGIITGAVGGLVTFVFINYFILPTGEQNNDLKLIVSIPLAYIFGYIPFSACGVWWIDTKLNSEKPFGGFLKAAFLGALGSIFAADVIVGEGNSAIRVGIGISLTIIGTPLACAYLNR